MFLMIDRFEVNAFTYLESATFSPTRYWQPGVLSKPAKIDGNENTQRAARSVCCVPPPFEDA